MRYITLLALILVWVSPGMAQASPEEAVIAHFEAIEAEEYTQADSYFSSAFHRAFKGDVATLNQYYTTRRSQIWRGFEVMSSEALGDEDHTTALVTVEFLPPEDSPIHVTERVYYYLVLERPSRPATDTDSHGEAWRIDIFDAFEFETLGEARRRPYLYTREAWPDPEGMELKSRQGLFRIQWSLESFFFDKFHYPLRLLGSDNRRDELIGGGYLTGTYPLSGFNDRPLDVVHVDEKSSGDFSYISFDTTGDDELDGYWLLLHGKVKGNYYFENSDIVYILSNVAAANQFEMAEKFAHYWEDHRDGKPLKLTAALQPLVPKGSTIPTLAQSGLGALVPNDEQHTGGEILPVIETPLLVATVPPAAEDPGQPDVEAVAEAAVDELVLEVGKWTITPEALMQYFQRRSGSLLELELPYEQPRTAVVPLLVYHYGFE